MYVCVVKLFGSNLEYFITTIRLPMGCNRRKVCVLFLNSLTPLREACIHLNVK